MNYYIFKLDKIILNFNKKNILIQQAEICFNLNEDKSIQLSCYSIKSKYTETNVRHLRNWIADVSNYKITCENVDLLLFSNLIKYLLPFRFLVHIFRIHIS